MRVKVYRNLHRGDWSIVSMRTGRVVGHMLMLTLADVTWLVQPAGNRKVRAEGRKNVHAYAIGDLGSLNAQPHPAHEGAHERITYNPYHMSTFQRMDGTPVTHCDVAYFALDGKAYIGGEIS